LIRSYSEVNAAVVFGVTGVCGTSSCEEVATFTSSIFGLFGSAGGPGTFLSTLFGLRGYKPACSHPAKMFLLVERFSPGRAVQRGELLLPTISAASSIKSVDLLAICCLQGEKTPTSQGWEK